MDVTIQDNYCSCGEYNETRGGAICFSGFNVKITGSTDGGSEITSSSPQGAIQGISTFLQLSGNITFCNNSGENGGAITLLNNAQLIFLENSRVTFVGNIATRYGGGILCGHCSGGNGVSFGSPECQLCSNMWLTTILMYGALLVAVLFMLNMTVMQGTFIDLSFMPISFKSMLLYSSTHPFLAH